MIGLALEGGGVRCAAQAGALAALSELGFAPDVIAGCGAGAWVASLYALGARGPELLRAVRDVRQAGSWMVRSSGRLRWMITGHLPATGFFSLERAQRMLRWQSMDAPLQDMALPLAVLAWDVDSASIQVLASMLPQQPTLYAWSRHGTVSQAVGASMAIPGLAAPVLWRGRRLAGGSFLWPSLDPALEAMGATRTLRLRVLSAGDARDDLLAIALSPNLAQPQKQEDVLLLPLPTQSGLLDFAWMEQHYRIGYQHIHNCVPLLERIWRYKGGKLLPFTR